MNALKDSNITFLQNVLLACDMFLYIELGIFTRDWTSRIFNLFVLVCSNQRLVI
jgi:hypothetical protein